MTNSTINFAMARRSLLVTASIIGFATNSQPCSAQANVPVEHDAALETIVVTAERRDANLQDVPISVTAITAAALETQGVMGTGDLPTIVPGVSMVPQFG